MLPSLGAQAEGGAAKQSYNYLLPRAVAPRGWPDYAQGAVRLDWDPDFWGGNRAALSAARLDAAAAGAEAAAARLAVSAGIAAAYADFAGLHAEQDAARILSLPGCGPKLPPVGSAKRALPSTPT